MEKAIGIDKNKNLIIQDLSGNTTLIAENVRWASPENFNEYDGRNQNFYFDIEGDIYYYTENADLYVYSKGESLLIDTDVFQINVSDEFNLIYSKHKRSALGFTYTLYSFKNGESEQIISNVDAIKLDYFENFAYNRPVNGVYPNLHYISQSQGKAYPLGDDITYFRNDFDNHVFTVKMAGDNQIISFYTETEDDLTLTDEYIFDKFGETIDLIKFSGDVLCVNSIYYYIAGRWMEFDGSVYITDDYLFFKSYGHDTSLYRVNLENGKQKIVAQNVHELTISNDKLYCVVNYDYDTELFQLYCADTDTVISENVSCFTQLKIKYCYCATCGAKFKDKSHYDGKSMPYDLCVDCFSEHSPYEDSTEYETN